MSADLEQQLTAFADALTRYRHVPGGVVVVADRSQQLFCLPFGLADVERAVPVHAGHRFEIGSISKTLTSILINQLIDAGRLGLSDPVSQHLPWVDLGPHTTSITLAHLLTHTAGIVSGADALPDDLGQAWTLRDRATTTPGDQFHYSNLGYVVLGLVLQSVTGEPLAATLQRTIFAPLAMSNAIGRVGHADRSSLAVGYAPIFDDRPWLPGDPLAPATWFEVAAADGNVALTAGDLTSLLRLLLSNGTVDEHAVLSGQAIDRMLSVPVLGSADTPERHWGPGVSSTGYGLGVVVETIAGNRCVSHGGGMVGYSSFVLADRDAGLAVGVLTNANGDGLAAQMFARFAHQAILANGAIPGMPNVDWLVRSEELDPAPTLAGTDSAGREHPVVLVSADDRTQVEFDGRRGQLYKDWKGRYFTDHQQLRLHPLHLFHSTDPATARGTDRSVELSAYLGHYRSYSPWFTNFRIVMRAGGLVLAAPGGVEAPTEDEELVELTPGVFRVGRESWRPERLVQIAAIAGSVVVIERDGCQYSRTDTP